MGLLGPDFKKLEKEGDIEGLLQALRHESWKTREIASSVLDRLNWKPKDNENKAWYLAGKRKWQELSGLGEPAIAPLAMTLTHSDEAARMVAGDALERVAPVNPKAAIPILSEALLSITMVFYPKHINQIRDRIVQILGKTGDPNAVSVLIKSIGTLEFERRKIKEGIQKTQLDYYIRQHYKVVGQAIHEIGEPAIIPLINNITNSGAKEFLFLFGSLSVNPLIEAVGHKDKYKRAAIVSALGTFDDDRINGILVNSLRDDSAWVRQEAAIQLRKRSWQPGNDEDNAFFLLAEIFAANKELNQIGLRSLKKPNIIERIQLSLNKMDELSAMGIKAEKPLSDSLKMAGEYRIIQFHRNRELLYKEEIVIIPIKARSLIIFLLSRLGKSSSPAVTAAMNDPDPLVKAEVEEIRLYHKKYYSPTVSRPTLPESNSHNQKPEKKKGWIYLVIGIIALCLFLIFGISNIMMLSSGDITNDPTLLLFSLGCCTLPLLVTAIVLLIIGIPKVFHK